MRVMYLHQNIRLLRKRQNLTQQGLAELTNKSHSTIVGYEKGINLPPLDTLVEMADILRASLDDFVLTDMSAKPAKSNSIYVEEKIADYQKQSDDWQFIARQLGRDLQDLRKLIAKECPRLWDTIKW